ncbi:MAG: redoxin family protein [Verrucomicrobiota bacterium]
MKSIILPALIGAFALISATAAEIGQGAPAFNAKDINGKAVSLGELRDKVVVLEWVNFGCPFVKKHYASGNMQKLQADYEAKGVVWITVNSAAKGKEGYLETAKMAEVAKENGNKATHFVIDDDGKIGKAFGAKVTPHMFIINKEGMLAYDGAIDSKATTEKDDLASADKLFANALDAVLAGKEVANAKNQPYGCGVKY